VWGHPARAVRRVSAVRLTNQRLELGDDYDKRGFGYFRVTLATQPGAQLTGRLDRPS
jgi:hypothetical protein